MFWLFVICKAVLVSVVALLAATIFRGRRFPQIEYWVWLGILVMLLLPPVIRLPIFQASLANIDARPSFTEQNGEEIQSGRLNTENVNLGQALTQQLGGGESVIQGQDQHDAIASIAINRKRDQTGNIEAGLQTVQQGKPRWHRIGTESIWIRGIVSYGRPLLVLIWIVGAICVAYKFTTEYRAVGRLLSWAQVAPIPPVLLTIRLPMRWA